ncbi:MAG TPA: hypothetical protein VKD69_10860 [Vicinamibacterales bacterium]|nr:hypothetical protein [Vicinamibacterales bacterium]
MREQRRRTFAAAALFAALTLIATYPIARAPGSYAFFSHADAQLNMWILAWDAHALAHDPKNLFNANIFSPEKRTLAYSETLLGYMPIAAPVLWLHGSPALAFNAVLLFSFVASAFAMYLLARHLTGRHWPSIVAGIVYAFVPYRFAHVPQIQLESMEWMPLAFLCLHLYIERRRVKYAAALAAVIAMQALCCMYYAIFLGIALGVATPLLLLMDPQPRRLGAAATLAAAAALAALAAAPIATEYLRVHRAEGLERTIDEVAQRSAVPQTYLSSPARLHQRLWAGAQEHPRDYLFPGVVMLLLAAIGIVGGTVAPAAIRGAEPSERRWLPVILVYGTVALLGVTASFGPQGIAGISVYKLVYAAGPLVHGIRQVSRFAVLAIFAASVLAAIGATMIEAAARRFGTVAIAAVACVAFLEVLVAPVRADRPGGDALVPVPPVPPVYEWLAQQPGRFAILELPFAPSGQVWENASYVYWSTVHWHGVVDAYSGFSSPSYPALARILKGFPDERSHEELRARHVRYIIVHYDRYRPWNTPLNVARVARTPWLQNVQQFPDVDVLELKPDARLLTRADGSR